MFELQCFYWMMEDGRQTNNMKPIWVTFAIKYEQNSISDDAKLDSTLMTQAFHRTVQSEMKC